MKSIRNICVFCGSSSGADVKFHEAAVALGADMARRGVGLVYGGGGTGLMGAIARSVVDGGGHVVGIIPGFLRQREVHFTGATEMHIVNDMHERKRMMFERADAFVALPGGIGTLEELVEQMTWSQLGQHEKPILLCDIAGFWRPLLSLLAHMRQAQFIRESTEVRYLVAEKVEDVVPMLEATGPVRRLA